MYTYPLKFEFPMISIGRQVDVTNGDGRFIMRAIDPFFSFKDSIQIIDGSGNEVMRANGDTSFRFMFRLFSFSFDWSITTPDEKLIAHIDRYWARMEEFKNVTDIGPSYGDAGLSVGKIVGAMVATDVNYNIRNNIPRRLVYEVLDREGGNVLGWIVPSRGTGWVDYLENFLPYATRRQILNLPFISRAYAPSYEFKIGDLYSPTVLVLKKQRDLFVDKYVLEKTGELTDQQERWAIPALTLATMFERQRFKDMTN